jgi:hypothetical protein
MKAKTKSRASFTPVFATNKAVSAGHGALEARFTGPQDKERRGDI